MDGSVRKSEIIMIIKNYNLGKMDYDALKKELSDQVKYTTTYW